MKRRKEHLVEKRDGRMEFLRATKLARSIDRAMQSVGVDESWRALELANVVLTGLRQQAETAAGGTATAAAAMTTAGIADAVQHVLVVTGQSNAAAAYGAVGAERARRHRSMATLGRRVTLSPSASRPRKLPGGDDPRLDRFGRE